MLTSTDTQRVYSLLKQLGCNPREIEIYLHCLQTGPESIQDIAKRNAQNRVTVHSAVERLVERGLLYETRRGKKRFIDAEKPERLRQIIEKKRGELHLMEANIEYVAKLLHQMDKGDESKPVVKFYEGVEGLKRMLEETLEAKGEVLVFTHVDIFSQLLDPDYLEDYFRRRAVKGIRTRLVFPDCPFAHRVHAKADQYKITIRLVDPGFGWKAGIFCWNNTIAIKSFTKGKITCTIIESEDIAFFYRKILYEMCWSQAAEI